jgi:hypothetical protein
MGRRTHGGREISAIQQVISDTRNVGKVCEDVIVVVVVLFPWNQVAPRECEGD